MLGQGGFGITYLGVHAALGRNVAIKEFFMKGVCERDSETSQVYVSNADNNELASRFRDKFLKEARNLASLEHQNIVSVIDVFEENGTAYYVMKYLSGTTLADKVKNGALHEADAVRYIRQVASALDYVHGKSMMHLDVKPANILLDNADNAVLIDFGLAKQYDTKGQQTSTTPVGISHGYAPMEQYKRGGVSNFSPATDIYSLGATLYKLVTGVTPPEASDVMNEGLPTLPQSVSAPVRSAIEKAMQFRVKDRPQSIAEFMSILALSQESKTSQPPVAVEKDEAVTVVAVGDETVVSSNKVAEEDAPKHAPVEVVSRPDISNVGRKGRGNATPVFWTGGETKPKPSKFEVVIGVIASVFSILFGIVGLCFAVWESLFFICVGVGCIISFKYKGLI